MIDIRPFSTLGHADHGWLDAHHHFSFADYRDPDRMGWGAIRVWNDDEIAAGSGFPTHPHANMEIITFLRTGAITHRDSLGNEGRTDAGDVQVMSAGSGIRHSEYNLGKDTTRLFQIWIIPDAAGGAPGWAQRAFPKADRTGAWQVLAAKDGIDGSLPIRADANVLGVTLTAGQSVTYDTTPDRHLYLVATTGDILVNRHVAHPRDGVAITNETRIEVTAQADTKVVLVDAR